MNSRPNSRLLCLGMWADKARQTEMNHRIKSRIFKILSWLPPKIGDAIYHSIQARTDRTSLEERIRFAQQSFEKVSGLLTGLKIDLAGKMVLEIGSGWLPLMPFFFRYRGNCRQVLTYDVNQHFNRKHIRRLIRVFTKDFHIPVSENKQDRYLLPAGIVYKPKSDASQLSIGAASIDVIFSRFLLEHVPPAEVLQLHKDLLPSLRPHGVIIHIVSTSDHRAFFDQSLSHWDFLRYSGPEWNNIQTRFDYHNRLRLPEYQAIFMTAGLAVQKLEYSVRKKKSEQYAKFQRLKIHSDFEKFSFEELTAGNLVFVLNKANPADTKLEVCPGNRERPPAFFHQRDGEGKISG